jgi:hypothetical protein
MTPAHRAGQAIHDFLYLGPMILKMLLLQNLSFFYSKKSLKQKMVMKKKANFVPNLVKIIPNCDHFVDF